jgi:hypothetical protein
MLAVDQFRESLIESPESALLEIHRSKISLHHAKAGYDYPTIRLPHTLSKLAGLPTHIYHTVHDGALAFLWLFRQDLTKAKQAQIDPRIYTAEVADSNPVELYSFF